ncbi:MAG: hypothetical protein ACU0DE_06250 [Paracoccus sp. (in: a-proteobacteria)]|uniref:hypothetical protein n=1 Tax=Paracoccus sp. TaxID=267 RepID=UPI0040592A52
MAPPVGWVSVHPEITPPANFHHFRDTTLIKPRRETGSLAPRPQGNGGGYGKLAGVTGRIEARVADKGGITLDELAAEPARTHGIDMHRGTVWRALRGLGLTHRKRPSGA